MVAANVRCAVMPCSAANQRPGGTDAELGDLYNERVIYSLSIHADYRCRNSGNCCSVDWDVPIEVPVYRSMVEAVSSGRLRPDADSGAVEPFTVAPDLPEGA